MCSVLIETGTGQISPSTSRAHVGTKSLHPHKVHTNPRDAEGGCCRSGSAQITMQQLLRDSAMPRANTKLVADMEARVPCHYSDIFFDLPRPICEARHRGARAQDASRSSMREGVHRPRLYRPNDTTLCTDATSSTHTERVLGYVSTDKLKLAGRTLSSEVHVMSGLTGDQVYTGAAKITGHKTSERTRGSKNGFDVLCENNSTGDVCRCYSSCALLQRANNSSRKSNSSSEIT
ncbi:hypothetical protein CBL_01502 [Carabus blaptoides fortunei]